MPEHLKHLSACRAFRHVLAHGPRNLYDLHDGDKVQRDDSIWSTSDVNTYLEASAIGDLHLMLLANNRLVFSNMEQNNDPDYAPRRLPSDYGFVGGFELNVKIRDTFDTSSVLVVFPQDDGVFNVTHLSE